MQLAAPADFLFMNAFGCAPQSLACCWPAAGEGAYSRAASESFSSVQACSEGVFIFLLCSSAAVNLTPQMHGVLARNQTAAMCRNPASSTALGPRVRTDCGQRWWQQGVRRVRVPEALLTKCNKPFVGCAHASKATKAWHTTASWQVFKLHPISTCTATINIGHSMAAEGHGV